MFRMPGAPALLLFGRLGFLSFAFRWNQDLRSTQRLTQFFEQNSWRNLNPGRNHSVFRGGWTHPFGLNFLSAFSKGITYRHRVSRHKVAAVILVQVVHPVGIELRFKEDV